MAADVIAVETAEVKVADKAEARRRLLPAALLLRLLLLQRQLPSREIRRSRGPELVAQINSKQHFVALRGNLFDRDFLGITLSL